MRCAFFFVVFFLLFFCQNIFCQIENLVNDKNIIWLAEFEHEYSVELQPTNKSDLHRFRSSNGKCTLTMHQWLKEKILSDLKNGIKTVYTDKELTKPLPPRKIKKLFSLPDGCALSKKDIASMNKKKGIEPFTIRPIWFSPRYGTKEVLFIDERDGKLHTHILAMAPLDVQYSGTEDYEPIAWIKLNDGRIKNTNVDSLIQVASTSINKTPIEIKSLKLRKGLINFQDYIYDEAVGGQNIVSATFNDGINYKIHDTKKIKEFYMSYDTLIVLDSITYEEKIKIIKNEFPPREVNKTKLIHEWYYDPKSFEIKTLLRALAPVREVTDVYGNHLYDHTMYYIVYLDD